MKGTTDEEGIVKFSSVAPQKYYLTAIRKEYSFGTGMDSIEVAEEEHTVKVLTGKRVAFSAYGSVTTLHGVAVVDKGTVVARTPNDTIE